MSSQNPYSAPTADLEVSAQPEAGELVWFSPKQVGWGSFWGTSLVGGYMMRQNALAAGDPRGAVQALWIGIGTFAVAIALGFVLPENVPSVALSGGIGFGMHQWAKLAWAHQIESGSRLRHVANGAAIKITLVGLLFAVVLILGAVFGAVYLFPDSFEG